MASLLLGTSVNMNMFSSANAQGMGQNNNQYDNSYSQSAYEQNPYETSSYDTSYDTQPSYDQKPVYGPQQQPSYDQQSSYGPQQQPSYDKPKSDYSQSSYSDSYSEYKTKDKKYECKTGPFEGFFVSSVEFCDVDHKFDDKKDKDVKVGPRGPAGPAGPIGPIGPEGPEGPEGPIGPNGTQGPRGFNGTAGTNGTNATGFECVACLLDALAKLETGAVVVDVEVEVPGILVGSLDAFVNITIPLAINLDVATLLQAQIGLSLLGDDNATIFEICAAIDDGLTVDIDVLLGALDAIILPLIDAQIDAQIGDIVLLLNTTGLITTPILDAILASINLTTAIGEINADIEASLELFNDCFGNVTFTSTVNGQSLLAAQLQSFNPPIQQMNPTIHQMNPTTQHNSLPSGDPMLQLQSSLSPILETVS
jgi:hypothetical protein